MAYNMRDDIKEVYFTEEQLHEKVAELGARITEDYRDKNPLIVSVLKGSYVFMADLTRAIDTPCNVDFMVVSSYGKGTKTMFSLVIVVMYSILNLPVILYSGAVVFEQIFDISGILGTSKFMAVAILCIIIGIIGGCYAIFGGLKAVAVSDTINGVGLIIGGLMIPFLGFAALSAATGGHGILDGIKYMVEADPAKMNAINAWNAPEPEVPWPLIITGMFFNNLYWWCTNQSFVQRSLAAKSLKEGQKGAIFCGFLKCLGPLYLVIPGVIAFYLPSIQDKLAAAGSSAIDFAYPALIAEIVPKPVMGFFAAVMFARSCPPLTRY